MKFEKLDINGHIILRAMLELDKDADTLAQAQSARKAEKVHRDAPSGRRRSIDEVNSQNYLGTLADIVCARLLEGYFKKHCLKIDVVRYDDIRTDDFQDHDQYDIKLSTQGREYLVEIRSSVCIYLSLAAMISRWQILGPYISSAKGSTETAKPFYLRPIFHLSSFEENKKTNGYQRTTAPELIRSGDLQLYFVGGATSGILEEKGRNEAGQELKQGKAEFRVLDITDGLDAKEMLDTIGQLAAKEPTDNRYDKTKT
ncbi:hypothetical protein [Pseudomonas aeruginosa]|uniref:hypothetical protein n=1 Tax=Pseudomonas aeruginosa TaxID=287 RepID=UPI001C9DA361|nr:hypothetical protein [Pseudomonas aeruginosa]MBY9653777.1 hypothetical protein [Pseudomonas aeruginosa]MBY9793032.1 hypothetical protein [Pseudomonas aeruginosa]MCA6860593.1 hypothetical protein [Pseudomonas aeruginosa]QZV53842.1 hypothetical protein KUU77_23595 [Pseudomonas aeruginosa]HCI2634411.1 hypothetical protein [Pseudomonas aeruginosa]